MKLHDSIAERDACMQLPSSAFTGFSGATLCAAGSGKQWWNDASEPVRFAFWYGMVVLIMSTHANDFRNLYDFLARHSLYGNSLWSLMSLTMCASRALKELLRPQRCESEVRARLRCIACWGRCSPTAAS